MKILCIIRAYNSEFLFRGINTQTKIGHFTRRSFHFGPHRKTASIFSFSFEVFFIFELVAQAQAYENFCYVSHVKTDCGFRFTHGSTAIRN